MRGTVVKSTGKWYDVAAEDNVMYKCRIKGKFRLLGQPLTNPVAVGDIVTFEQEGSDLLQGLITEIAERENYVVRQSPSRKHALHLLASNIDQALLVVTIIKPNLKQGFIDRFLLMTEPQDIPVIIAFNKADLYGEEEWNMYDYLHDVYTEIGYKVLSLSAKEGEGVDELLALLRNNITLISGQSGVGKSTLINQIAPELDIQTTMLSSHTGKGQHTTTFAEMHTIEDNMKIIDTPGIKTLSFNNLTPQDVRHNFREFFEYSKHCKFSDCTHINEPQCAVKQAIEEGEISELRYLNYLKILEEIEKQNRWERPKNY